MSNPPIAYARCLKIKNMTALATTEAHARRHDNSKHVDRTRTAQTLVSGYGESPDPLAIQDAYKRRKRDAGASERKGSAIGLHLLLGISPQWVAETGDLHDPQNPRNQQLFEQARAFAEAKFGPGSVIHTRLDVDEAGGGVVDVIAVPVTEFTQRGKTKRQVSPNAGLEAAFGAERGNLRHLQTQWAEHCQQTLEPAAIRGKPRKQTQTEHVEHNVYRPAAQAAARLLEEARNEADEIRKNAALEAQKIQRAATQKANKKAADEWAEAGFTGRRQKALEVAKAEGKAEGRAEVRKQAQTALANQKKSLEEANSQALAEQAKANRHETSVLERTLAQTRYDRDLGWSERDALAVKLVETEQTVSTLRRVIETIRERLPTPLKTLVDAVLNPKQPEPPEPSREVVRGPKTSSFTP